MKIFTTDEMRKILEEFVGKEFDYNDIIAAFDTEDYIYVEGYIYDSQKFYFVYQENGAKYDGVRIKITEDTNGNEIITAVY